MSKIKDETQCAERNAERWDVLGVHNYIKDKTTGETGVSWIRVGRAFQNPSGGFTIKMRAVPAAQDGEITIIIKKYDPNEKPDWDLP